MLRNSIPNLFTLGNLSFGLLSIIMTFQDNFRLACIFILLAGVMDRYDGRVARYLNVDSEIGKELDSLADLVSFGVAPAMLMFSMYEFSKMGTIGYAFVLIFPLAGAYRLARYNCTDFDGSFMGVPITIAGSLMALFGLIPSKDTSNSFLPIVFLVILSYLMISKFKIKKV